MRIKFNNRVKIVTLFLALVAMVCLSACVKNQIYKPATYSDDSAIIYLFRPNHALSRGNMLRVYVNEKRQENLLNNAYLPLEVNPGKITLKLMTDEMLTSGKLDSLEMNVQKGETYYVKAKPGVFGAFSLVQLSEDEGSEEIKDKYLYEQ